jgi:hypothetical protein
MGHRRLGAPGEAPAYALEPPSVWLGSIGWEALEPPVLTGVCAPGESGN